MPVAVVVGVFVSNVPEALSGSAGLHAAGWARMRVFRMWSWVVAASVVSTVAGWLLLDRMPTAGGAFADGVRGGRAPRHADTLMPEAFQRGGREAGLVTALGFAVGFGLS